MSSFPIPSQLPAHYRRASAIARLAWIRQFGLVEVACKDEQEFVVVHFHSVGPLCKCCGKPIPRQEWLRFILGDYVQEVKELIHSEDPLSQAP